MWAKERVVSTQNFVVFFHYKCHTRPHVSRDVLMHSDTNWGKSAFCVFMALSFVFYSLGHRVECSVSKECTLEAGTPEKGTLATEAKSTSSQIREMTC